MPFNERPFTERELRAMLEDNSADVPPTHDLAATAETGGRRARRRRYLIGGAATAAALTVGFTVIPGLFANDGPGPAATDRNTALATTVSPSTTTRPDVDLARLDGDGFVPMIRLRDGDGPIARPTEEWLKYSADDPIRIVVPGGARDGSLSYYYTAAGHPVAGTVTGVTLLAGSERKDKRPGAALVGLKVRVDRELARERGVKNPVSGEVTIALGTQTSESTDRIAQAIPVGTRTVAFISGITVVDEKGAADPLRYASHLVFEDTDGTLVGGPYDTKPVPDPWSKATTYDELVALVEKGELSCWSLSYDPNDKSLSLAERKAALRLRAKNPTLGSVPCLNLESPNDPPTAKPSEVRPTPPPVQPTATPSESQATPSPSTSP